MNSAARCLNPDPGLQGVCEGPEFRLPPVAEDQNFPWGPQASGFWMAWNSSLGHSFPPRRQGGRLSEVPPTPRAGALQASRPKWQVSLCGRWADPGQAWKRTGVTWSPWKGIPKREASELKSQRIQPVFDDDSYSLRRTAQCSDLCGAEALECQGNPVQVEELQALRE